MGGCNMQVVKSKTSRTIEYSGGPYHGERSTKTVTTTEKCDCNLTKTEMYRYKADKSDPYEVILCGRCGHYGYDHD